MIKKTSFLFFSLFFFSVICYGQKYYTVKEVPDPKTQEGGYVSDPDHLLTSDGVSALNSAVAALEDSTKVQVAIVVLRDFEQDKNEFDFAMELFHYWGIGKKKADNGLLLLVAADRHRYRFITGYGLEGLLPDATLKRIGDHFLVPAFRKEDYSGGTVQAINTISAFLSQPENGKELEGLLRNTGRVSDPLTTAGYLLMVALLFTLGFRDLKKRRPKVSGRKDVSKFSTTYDSINGFGCLGLIVLVVVLVSFAGFSRSVHWLKELDSLSTAIAVYILLSISFFFRYLDSLSAIRKTNPDEYAFLSGVKKSGLHAIWYLPLSPLILLSILAEQLRAAKSASRFVPPLDTLNRPMIRVNRNRNGKPLLSKGQQKEEQLGVNTYEIWLSEDKQEQQVKAYEGPKFRSCKSCPACHFRTYQYYKQRVTVSPTYRLQGQAKETNICANCGHEEILREFALAKLERVSESSGSSGGGSSSSSSSSSGSSSSWGGGSSGGGGAGGSW